jgi:hypothetical protein
MIRLSLQTDKGPIGIIGINDENLVRMKAGMPLDIDIKALTPPGMKMNRLVVHYAHTYEQVLEDMANGGIPVTEEIREQAKAMDAQLKEEKRE